MADGIAQVQLAEMVVSGLALRYMDRKSGEARDEGRTRPEVIMRQLTTRPGQVEQFPSLFSAATRAACAPVSHASGHHALPAGTYRWWQSLPTYRTCAPWSSRASQAGPQVGADSQGIIANSDND